MDFFAGSGTSGQAVLELNSKDGGKRKFILVQLPESTGREDYRTISDITKARVGKVITKLNQDSAESNGGNKEDRGFRVFKLAESNFKPWAATVPPDADALTAQLEMHVEHLRIGRTDQDILYEILLKSGFPLTVSLQTIQIAGKTAYSIPNGALFICLERHLTLESIRAMAERRPARVVCLDEGFAGNDQLKANAVHIFRGSGVVSFKTV